MTDIIMEAKTVKNSLKSLFITMCFMHLERGGPKNTGRKIKEIGKGK